MPRDFQDDDFLYRRVRDDHLQDNEVQRAHCPTDQWEENLSFDWSALRDNPADTAQQDPGHLLRISVKDCREIGLGVCYDPEEGNPSHTVLVVPSENRHRTGIAKIREQFLGRAKLLRVECGTIREIGPAKKPRQ